MSLKKRLGDLLIEVGAITSDQLSRALEIQKDSGKKLGEILIEQRFITESELIEVLEFQLSIPHVELERYFIDPEIPMLISETLAKRHQVLPIKRKEDTITLAMSDPLNLYAIEDVEIATGLSVEPVIVTRKDISDSLDQYYGAVDAKKAIEDFKDEFSSEDLDQLDDEALADINNAPVVRLIDSVVSQAVRSKASDIHIEPFESYIRIRFRIDGDLREIMRPSKNAHSAIVTRIKIMGKMDISERRKPQDGRVERTINNRDVDMRISVLPTVFGEKVVIRLLDRNSFMMSKEDLGFTENNLNLFNEIAKNPNGIMLITGPTGSGKSTTLYTVLNDLNQEEKNIVTVEDPVEYSLEGVTQVQVNPKADLTFASGLRSILRQDPDIIMIGEIRDVETVNIAVRAAITGHLVLSTLHTNDTTSTINRLLNMGIDRYLIASSVVGIVAQRLVKKVCPYCKNEAEVSHVDAKLLNVELSTKIYEGKGCNKCDYSGTLGRTAVHEVMPVTRSIRDMINNQTSIDVIKDQSVTEGMKTLYETCRELVLEGKIPITEMMKITYSLDV
ncbi:type IV pilus assembly protein PilB [Pelagirhabdus alkalitolerans]|uniref:Type IV pilus assembly protein PilB n=1 Tax=Pelagirhabdus alkalitolerans TaxID=1612202 RepID=A0A1G6HP42_9BACI|nr:ATPase, T2SS/T4P/T4SS family [Pelagirhabdus alkalitolerans]SDB95635.1 type IV pilus assembly protein PilB [Pelagirhabdus alkalitolerans]